MQSFESRVERRYLETISRIGQKTSGKFQYPQVKTSVQKTPTNYLDVRIAKYKAALEEALQYAPCPGCRKLVLGALVGLEIFKAMDENGKSRAEISDAEINRIKKSVEQKYEH